MLLSRNQVKSQKKKNKTKPSDRKRADRIYRNQG